ncbi:MAG: hypothetical protein IJT16_07690 [Lachnospiraceae bacterium]|nr:hypothetical protein [Lachnospiraceae bacterium]
MKRILALAGVAVLVLMYVLTLIFALSGSENYFGMMMGSIAATIIIPIFLYAFLLVYKAVKRDPDEEEILTDQNGPESDNNEKL